MQIQGVTKTYVDGSETDLFTGKKVPDGSTVIDIQYVESANGVIYCDVYYSDNAVTRIFNPDTIAFRTQVDALQEVTY